MLTPVVGKTGAWVKDVGFGIAVVMFGLRTLSMTWMTPFAISMSVVVMRAELRK